MAQLPLRTWERSKVMQGILRARLTRATLAASAPSPSVRKNASTPAPSSAGKRHHHRPELQTADAQAIGQYRIEFGGLLRRLRNGRVIDNAHTHGAVVLQIVDEAERPAGNQQIGLRDLRIGRQRQGGEG